MTALELSDAPSVVGDFTYTRIATDSNNRSDTFTLTLHVNPPPRFDDSQARLNATPGGMPTDEDGNALAGKTQQLPTVSGGSGAIAYAVSPTGERGAGLTVVLDSATAMLTYGASAAAEPGIYQYELTATDANGATVSLVFDIEVHEGLDVVGTDLDAAIYTIGVPLTLPDAEGGLAPYSFEIALSR